MTLNKQTAKKRKLIAESEMALLHGSMVTGIPLARALRVLDLDISRPTAGILVGVYQQLLVAQASKHGSQAKVIKASLFPAWLDRGASVQPDGWAYAGWFPTGQWVQIHE